MKVRVLDKETGRYFKSEVYALVNTGWYERRLVRMPGENGGCMRFFDYLDREAQGHPVLINKIVPGVLRIGYGAGRMGFRCRCRALRENCRERRNFLST